ncbi:MAG: hypothetical protein HRS57_02585 [Mycoplasmataceae bacterium]|nr:hypothetical protein [Mycoplasmataceae bacterium]
MQNKATEKTEHKKRVDRIVFIYHFYLLKYNDADAIDKALDIFKYDFDNEQIKILEIFVKQRRAAESYISQFISKKWKWDRLEPLIKAILINSTIEITNNLVEKAISINEAVIICKDYSHHESAPMVNAILDKVKPITRKK